MYSLCAVLIGILLADTGRASPLRFLLRQENSYTSQCPLSTIPVSTNNVQASIISQQKWNLCSYKSNAGQTTLSCSSNGIDSMTPFFTTSLYTAAQQSGTYIATYLTEYATLTAPALVTSTDCTGAVSTFSVGELGQGGPSPSSPIRHVTYKYSMVSLEWS